ncbi:MAG TPA: type II toxin-antitoxin system Phd/YefM family antitoxin [Telluria sp.]
MKFSGDVKPLSYLTTHTRELAQLLAESREPILITDEGEAKLVVMGVRTYEDNQQTIALLKILAAGNVQLEDGQFRPANDVFADLDKNDNE